MWKTLSPWIRPNRADLVGLLAIAFLFLAWLAPLSYRLSYEQPVSWEHAIPFIDYYSAVDLFCAIIFGFAIGLCAAFSLQVWQRYQNHLLRILLLFLLAAGVGVFYWSWQRVVAGSIEEYEVYWPISGTLTIRSGAVIGFATGLAVAGFLLLISQFTIVPLINSTVARIRKRMQKKKFTRTTALVLVAIILGAIVLLRDFLLYAFAESLSMAPTDQVSSPHSLSQFSVVLTALLLMTLPLGCLLSLFRRRWFGLIMVVLFAPAYLVGVVVSLPREIDAEEMYPWLLLIAVAIITLGVSQLLLPHRIRKPLEADSETSTARRRLYPSLLSIVCALCLGWFIFSAQKVDQFQFATRPTFAGWQQARIIYRLQHEFDGVIDSEVHPDSLRVEIDFARDPENAQTLIDLIAQTDYQKHVLFKNMPADLDLSNIQRLHFIDIEGTLTTKQFSQLLPLGNEVLFCGIDGDLTGQSVPWQAAGYTQFSITKPGQVEALFHERFQLPHQSHRLQLLTGQDLSIQFVGEGKFSRGDLAVIKRLARNANLMILDSHIPADWVATDESDQSLKKVQIKCSEHTPPYVWHMIFNQSATIQLWDSDLDDQTSLELSVLNRKTVGVFAGRVSAEFERQDDTSLHQRLEKMFLVLSIDDKKEALVLPDRVKSLDWLASEFPNLSELSLDDRWPPYFYEDYRRPESSYNWSQRYSGLATHPNLEGLYLPERAAVGDFNFLSQIETLKKLQLNSRLLQPTRDAKSGNYPAFDVRQCKSLEELILFGIPKYGTIEKLVKALPQLKRVQILDTQYELVLEDPKLQKFHFRGVPKHVKVELVHPGKAGQLVPKYADQHFKRVDDAIRQRLLNPWK